MNKDFLVYSLLLALGLGTAYYVTLPEEASSDEVSWIKIDPQSVESLSYTGEGKSVEITRLKDSDGFWVKHSHLKPGQEEAVVTEFKANEKITEVLGWFNPLYAKREIGSADELDLKEFALDAPKESLVIKGKDNTLLDLKIGKRAYGSRNDFLKDVKRDAVLLVAGSQIENVIRADSSMIERQLYALDTNATSKVEIKVGDNTKVIDHSKKNGAGALIWTDPDKEDENATYKNLMTKISKLQVKSYGSEQNRQTVAALIPFAELVLYKGSDQAVILRFVKQTGVTPVYWVWSNFLGAYAQIETALAENLERDLPAVVLE